MYLPIGSSRASLPSWTSCRMTVDVMVLVLLPIRKWSSTDIGSSAPSVPVPKVPVQSPWSGEATNTTAPGMTLFFITVSTAEVTAGTYAGWEPALLELPDADDAGEAAGPVDEDVVDEVAAELDDVAELPEDVHPVASTRLAASIDAVIAVERLTGKSSRRFRVP
jgi:hypothetical protein